MSFEPRVFVIYPDRSGGSWSVDGAHGVGDDLTATLAILKRLGVRPPVLKLTIGDDPRVGGAWPAVEDMTLDLAAVKPASEWSATDAADAESERAFYYERAEGLLPDE